MAATKCAHAGCDCDAENGRYCSSYCEKNELDSVCGCGHANCKAASVHTAGS